MTNNITITVPGDYTIDGGWRLTAALNHYLQHGSDTNIDEDTADTQAVIGQRTLNRLIGEIGLAEVAKAAEAYRTSGIQAVSGETGRQFQVTLSL